MRELQFPGFTIRFSTQLPEQITLMVLGGRTPDAGWLKRLNFYAELWCADRGVEVCRDAGLAPQRLIGDMDSASAVAWDWAAGQGAVVSKFEKDKDLTDFQLSLELLRKESTGRPKGVFLTGAFGGRFDHLWSVALSFLYWDEAILPIGMADEREALFLLRGGQGAEVHFTESPGALSLIPFEDSGGVSLTGTKWELNDANLLYAKPYSISNQIGAENQVSVSVGSGLIGLYLTWPSASDASL